MIVLALRHTYRSYMALESVRSCFDVVVVPLHDMARTLLKLPFGRQCICIGTHVGNASSLVLGVGGTRSDPLRMTLYLDL